MVSPNGAQSLDGPLGAIGHGSKPVNLSSDLPYSFNSLLKSAISNSIAEEMHHQNPSPSPSFLVGGAEIPGRDDTSAIEDFLIRTAGAAADRSHHPMAAAGEEWMQFQLAADRVSKYEGSGFDGGGGGVGYNVVSEEKAVGVCGAAAEEKRRRCSEDLKEKTIERKQKRMIKNRESAARSRARKQVLFTLICDFICMYPCQSYETTSFLFSFFFNVYF